jgi:hypothetical protein
MATDASRPAGVSWIKSSYSHQDHAECVQAAVLPTVAQVAELAGRGT